MTTKIIYDFGSNNGDDIPYYLLKADRVVAVEANPTLCEHIRSRFAAVIRDGRLVVENCVLTIEPANEATAFYIHKTNHVLSQFPEPQTHSADYEKVFLPARNVTSIVEEHGTPYYIKLDVEQYDQVLLRELLTNRIAPPYISAESHTIQVFCQLVATGCYNAFKIVDGSSVATLYGECTIHTAHGTLSYSFPHHSAGPFGNDIHGPWMSAENFWRVLAFLGLGWKDIHASSVDTPDWSYAPQHPQTI